MMEQREAEHMEVIADQFAWLKSSIDGLISSNKSGIPVVSSITLGSRELPYLLSVRAFGNLEISKNAVNIIIDEGSNPLPEFNLNSINYNSLNAYFIDQSFIYENGGVIVSQDDGEMIYIRPSFFKIQEEPQDEPPSLFVNLINISVVGEKSSASGYGTYPIQTEFNNVIQTKYSGVTSILIETTYSNSWKSYMNYIIDRLDIKNQLELNYVLIEDTETGFSINFNPPVTLTAVYFDILAQVGPGWVESD